MGELRVNQRDHMTPRTESAGLFIDPGFPRQLGHQKSGMKLQICRTTLNFDGAGTVGFFFIPAVWQG